MGDFWKPTAEMFSSLFERPKMAQKLLQKPPFKYLFDIITETTKATGFGSGLLTQEETSAEFYQTREKKMAYLQKFVDLIRVMGKEEIAAKPAKIVAGLEPENTNAMLQSLYKLAVSGNSSDPYIGKVLGREEAPTKKEEAPTKKEQAPSKKAPKPKAEEEPVQQQKEQPPPPQENQRVTRPPSAPRRGMRPPGEQPAPPQKEPASKPSAPKQVPPPAEEQQAPSQKKIEQEPQKDTGSYSKKVKEAMQENEVKEAEPQQEPAKKMEMGNLRKRKNQGRIDGGDAVSAVGEISEKELESVKALIQSICQNSTPLGKSIQFVNDDVEAMNQELSYWRKQYNVSKGKMQNELKITDDALVPMYDKLAEIEEQVKDQKGKIQNMKSQIIKNQATINALLYSVVKG